MFCWQSIIAMPCAAAEADQRGQRDLRGVGAAREHRLAENSAADRHAVQAAGQLAVDPGLDAVRVAGAVQGARRRAPSRARSRCRSGPSRGACAQALDHARRSAWSMRISQPGRGAGSARSVLRSERCSLKRADLQHHARVRAPPQHRLAFAEPGEDAVRVGLQQARRRRARRRRPAGRARGRIRPTPMQRRAAGHRVRARAVAWSEVYTASVGRDVIGNQIRGMPI